MLAHCCLALLPYQQKGFDVFTALDVMDNKNFLEKLKFTISGKSVHYYLYNWGCPNISPDKVSITATARFFISYFSYSSTNGYYRVV